jgi:hypothetical protein
MTVRQTALPALGKTEIVRACSFTFAGAPAPPALRQLLAGRNIRVASSLWLRRVGNPRLRIRRRTIYSFDPTFMDAPTAQWPVMHPTDC